MDDDNISSTGNQLKLTREELLNRIIEMQGLPEEIVKKFLDAKGKLKSRNNEEK